MRDKKQLDALIGVTVLDALSKHVHKERGNLADVIKRFHEITGKTVHHPTMLRWLHRDRKQRTEPLLGTGLVLMEIWRNIQRERGEEMPLFAATAKLLDEFIDFASVTRLEPETYRLSFGITRSRDSHPLCYLEKRFTPKTKAKKCNSNPQTTKRNA
jgi:hypothetical protein